MTCPAGMICLEIASGALLIECRANSCGTGPVNCGCLPCQGNCYVQATVQAGIRVTCNNMPASAGLPLRPRTNTKRRDPRTHLPDEASCSGTRTSSARPRFRGDVTTSSDQSIIRRLHISLQLPPRRILRPGGHDLPVAAIRANGAHGAALAPP
jgi:hypothetical protein